ncbi:MAG: ATP-binding cassette domain-containing protein [Bacilli bacterium]
MICVKEMCKKYHDKHIFSKLSLTIEDGEFVVITGRSGKGKTTLLHILGLIEDYDEGEFKIDGIPSREKNRLHFFRNQAAYIFQNYALIEEQTVAGNLLLAIAFEKEGKSAKREKIKEVLTQLGLEGYLDKKIYNLSGGEQQRVALARAILKNPKYIFADEPTGNLDSHNREIVFSILRQLHANGSTVIVVSHDVDVVVYDNVTQHINLDEK